MLKGGSAFVVLFTLILQSCTAINADLKGAELVYTPDKMVLNLPSGKQVNLLNVPDVYHYYNYSSGHTALQAIFSYYQFPTDASKYREDTFNEPTDYDQNQFSPPEKLVEAAYRKLSGETDPEKQNVFDIQVKEELSIDELKSYIDRSVPIILLITKKPTADIGAYVVAIGYDSEYFYFEDPYKMGSIGYLPKNEFEEVWKNYIKSQKRQTKHLAIIMKFKKNRLIVPLVRPCP